MSVFAEPAPTHEEPELAHLSSLGIEPADFSRLRVLQEGLGKYDSRLVAFPSESEATICYALLGRRGQDPGMSYCYQPAAADLPSGLVGQHFNVVALYSFDGEPRVQLFGVAFDDVAGVRVQAGGTWRDVPVVNNGLYLDLPEVQHEEVGTVEATLADGTLQTHDIQAGQ